MKIITLRLPEDLHAQFKVYAHEANVSMNMLCQNYVREFVKNAQENNEKEAARKEAERNQETWQQRCSRLRCGNQPKDPTEVTHYADPERKRKWEEKNERERERMRRVWRDGKSE